MNIYWITDNRVKCDKLKTEDDKKWDVLSPMSSNRLRGRAKMPCLFMVAAPT